MNRSKDDVRHLEMAELLELRDGEGNSQARAHLELCARCRAEVEQLLLTRERLRALPEISPSHDAWPAVAERLYSRRRWRRVGLGAVLLAAAVVSGLLVLKGPVDQGASAPDVAAVDDRRPVDLQPYITRSQELETVLSNYIPDRPVLDAGQALAVSVLEERLLLIDEALLESQTGSVDQQLVRDLWERRVETLETLVGVHLVPQAELGAEDDGWR